MKKLTWGIAAAGLAMLPLAWLGRGSAPAGAEDLSGMERYRVARRDLRTTVKASGVIKPMIGAEVRVGSRASGVVERLHARIGDRVEKGQLLAKLEDRELIARRDQAVAALDASRAQLEFARSDLGRKRELFASRLIAPGDLDVAERTFAVARQRCTEAAANLAYASTQLGYARIRAPISGVVGSISTQEGKTVSASLAAPTFVTLLDLDRLEVRAYVDETDIGRISIGQNATFTVDTYRDEAFGGVVTAIYPQAEIRDNVVDYVTVVAFDPPPAHVLRPEMTTTVTITVERREGVLVVPRGAVRRGTTGSIVYRPRGNEIEERAVVTGAHDDSYWEIVDGLDEGDTVLVGRVSAGLEPSR